MNVNIYKWRFTDLESNQSESFKVTKFGMLLFSQEMKAFKGERYGTLF